MLAKRMYTRGQAAAVVRAAHAECEAARAAKAESRAAFAVAEAARRLYVLSGSDRSLRERAAEAADAAEAERMALAAVAECARHIASLAVAKGRIALRAARRGVSTREASWYQERIATARRLVRRLPQCGRDAAAVAAARDRVLSA